jgi:hypothetical protein
VNNIVYLFPQFAAPCVPKRSSGNPGFIGERTTARTARGPRRLLGKARARGA